MADLSHPFVHKSHVGFVWLINDQRDITSIWNINTLLPSAISSEKKIGTSIMKTFLAIIWLFNDVRR